jgi:hypothetical protein
MPVRFGELQKTHQRAGSKLLEFTGAGVEGIAIFVWYDTYFY